MKQYKITEEDNFNPDEIIQMTGSIKELLSFEFNDEIDNISRNFKLLQLLYEKISSIEIQLKNKGII
jgi:hypothetical protein